MINEFKIKNKVLSLFKFADDMALMGLLRAGDIGRTSTYYEHIKTLFEWCQLSALVINTDKTMELVITGDKWNTLELEPIVLDGNPIEFVCNFKYLGIFIDAQLIF